MAHLSTRSKGLGGDTAVRKYSPWDEMQIPLKGFIDCRDVGGHLPALKYSWRAFSCGGNALGCCLKGELYSAGNDE